MVLEFFPIDVCALHVMLLDSDVVPGVPSVRVAGLVGEDLGLFSRVAIVIADKSVIGGSVCLLDPLVGESGECHFLWGW